MPVLLSMLILCLAMTSRAGAAHFPPRAVHECDASGDGPQEASLQALASGRVNMKARERVFSSKMVRSALGNLRLGSSADKRRGDPACQGAGGGGTRGAGNIPVPPPLLPGGALRPVAMQERKHLQGVERRQIGCQVHQRFFLQERVPHWWRCMPVESNRLTLAFRTFDPFSWR